MKIKPSYLGVAITELGLKQIEFAELCGVSQSVISRAINGEDIATKTAYKIAKGLDKDINDIIVNPIKQQEYVSKLVILDENDDDIFTAYICNDGYIKYLANPSFKVNLKKL